MAKRTALNKKLVMRKSGDVMAKGKLRMLMVVTIVGGVALMLASTIYQVKPLIVDAEEIHYGFPFVWLTTSRNLWSPTPWRYHVQWAGLIGDIAIYSWITFIISYLTLHFHSRFLKSKSS